MSERTPLPDLDPAPRSRRGCFVRSALLAALLLGLVIAGLFLWLTRSTGGRAVVLEQVRTAVEARSGWSLDAADFDLDLSEGRIAIDDFRLGAPGEEPLVTAGRAEARVEWSSLRQGVARILSLRLDDPVIDLRHPFPAPRPDDDAGGGGLPTIEQIEIRGGRIEGAPVDRGWLHRWRLVDLVAEGRLVDGAFAVDLSAGDLILERSDDSAPIQLAVRASAKGDLDGPYEITDLRVDGDGFDLDASGVAGRGADEPLRFAFELDAQPALLLPELASGAGAVRASGDLDLRRVEGEIDVTVDDLPPEVLEPFIDPNLMARLEARGTSLDADATLRLTGRDPDQIRGQAQVIWTRPRPDGEEVLAQLDARTESASDETLRVGFDLELLPGRDDVLSANGVLLAPAWTALGDARLDATRVTVDSPDLTALVAALESRWADLVPATDNLPLRGRLTATATLEGPLAALRVPNVEALWLPTPDERPDASARLVGEGTLATQRGAAELTLESFDLAALDSGIGGVVDGAVTVSGGLRDSSLRTDLTARNLGSLEGDGPPWLREATLRAALVNGRRLELERFAGLALLPDAAQGAADGLRQLPFAVQGTADLALGRFEAGSVGTGGVGTGGVGTGSGQTSTDRWLRSADLEVHTERPVAGVESVTAQLGLVDGVAQVRLVDWQGTAGTPQISTFEAILPLGALASIPGAAEAVDALPSTQADGRIDVRFIAPNFDSAQLVAFLGLEERAERLFGSIEASVSFDPDTPTAAVGTITVDSMAVEVGDRRMEADGPVVARLGERRLELDRSTWSVEDNPFVLEGHAELAPGWQLDDDPATLLRDFDVLGDGTFALALLDPYLAGGTGQGLAQVLLRASGTPDDFDGELRMTSSEGAIRFLTPYATQIAEPEIVLGLDDGRIAIRQATARLNQGTVEAEGIVDPSGVTRLEGFFDRVRYRVDYGLTVLASGNFELTLPAEGRERKSPPVDSRGVEPQLTANVLIERGFLRRNVDTDREILDLLLAPPELDRVDDGDSFSRDLRLDLDIATVEGIYVRNNLADLKASWAPLRVEGTLAEPRVQGSIEVDPGGRIYAYGQVIRVDRGVLEFSGDPRIASELDIETTTSLDDPSIATPEDQRALAALDRRSSGPERSLSEQEEARRKQEALGSGLQTYYASRLTSRLGRGLAGTNIEYKKLFIFSEADPQAQLVISRDLSARIGLALALDLRNAEERTYLLDLRRFGFMPSLTATLFTSEKSVNDGSNYGAALQQALELGRPAPPRDDDRPILHDLEIVCPECESERPIRRGITYTKDERIEEGADFDVEVDVAESMRAAGFTAAVVRAELTARDDTEVDLRIAVDPGPKATFEFTGETPPRKRRDGIRDLYRADFYEDASIEEMREQTVRVWQSRGHAEPRVEVRVERIEASERGDRRVIIHSDPGPEIEIDEIRIEGVPDDVAEAIIDLRFASTLARVELAVGDAGADRVVLRSLENAGFESAEILERRFEDGLLTLGVEAGPRTILESIEIVSVGEEPLSDDLVASLEEQVDVAVGDPAVVGRVAQQATALERSLRDEGYLDARVRNRSVVREDVTDRSRLVFEVDTGKPYRLERVEVQGEVHTDPDWIRDSAKLEPGELLASTEVAEARRRLVETRVFETVRVDTTRDDSDATLVTFDLEENPRYSVAYGLRYSKSDDIGAAIDAVDRNFLGRGISLGARALYAQQVSSFRLYTEVPRFLESPVDLEFFAEVFDEDFETFAADGYQLGGQATFPLADHLRGRGYLRYRDADETDKTQVPPQLARQRSPVLGLQLIYDTRLDPLDPRSGLLASLDISGSSQAFGAEVRYLRGFAQLAHYWSPRAFDGDLVLAQSVRAGYADVIDGVLPFDVRFFAGGQYSVRGYDSRSLGDRQLIDGSLEPLGGTAQLVFNEELRYRVLGDVWAVLFYDAGNVWSLADDFGDDLRVGYGIGTRIGTPIGLVRLDFGRAEDRRPDDDEYQIYFGLGHAF